MSKIFEKPRFPLVDFSAFCDARVKPCGAWEKVVPSEQIRQFTEAGEKGTIFPGLIVPEASTGIPERPTSYPIVDLGGARLISWAPARLQELLPKSGGRRGQSPLSPHRHFGNYFSKKSCIPIDEKEFKHFYLKPPTA